MATLYVENFPDELYDALRQQAKSRRRSIAAETISMIEQMVPTAAERKRRMAFYLRAKRIASRNVGGPGPSAEEMVREDRER